MYMRLAVLPIFFGFLVSTWVYVMRDCATFSICRSSRVIGTNHCCCICRPSTVVGTDRRCCISRPSRVVGTDLGADRHCCFVCHRYGAGDDPKLSDDWVPCQSCSCWYHSTCAEVAGVIDDDDTFLYASCIWMLCIDWMYSICRKILHTDFDLRHLVLGLNGNFVLQRGPGEEPW